MLQVLGAPARWRPVLERELVGAAGAPATGSTAERELRERVQARAGELGLQPLRWPAPFPFDSRFAMRVATYAASIGRCVPFTQAAFRQAFAGGHALDHPDFVLIAAAACEMHPEAVLRGAELRSVAHQLAASTAAAAAAGITTLPAITLGEQVFQGEHAPERAAAHLRALRVPPASALGSAP